MTVYSVTRDHWYYAHACTHHIHTCTHTNTTRTQMHTHTQPHTHIHTHTHTHTLQQGKSAAFLKYSDPKQIIFDSNPEQGVVYNVIAVDKMRLTRTAYVPAVTYACNFHSNTSSCHTKFQAANAVVGVVVGLSGLFLCFLGHRFFHLGK